jgi:ribosomal protein S17
MSVDMREARIIYQNALAHATKIAIHNSKGDKVSVEDVITIAKQIATEVVKIGRKEK